MQTVCICFSGDYDLARATANAGDLFLFDANSGPIPGDAGVWPTHFIRPGNILGKACIQSLWLTYLEVMGHFKCDAVLIRPADTRILCPEKFLPRPDKHLIGVHRDETPTWRQWGCGQSVTRAGVELALSRLPTANLRDCGEKGREPEDLVLSFLLRDVSASYASFRACFLLRGDRPGPETYFINYDNLDIRARTKEDRRDHVLQLAAAIPEPLSV